MYKLGSVWMWMCAKYAWVVDDSVQWWCVLFRCALRYCGHKEEYVDCFDDPKISAILVVFLSMR